MSLEALKKEREVHKKLFADFWTLSRQRTRRGTSRPYWRAKALAAKARLDLLQRQIDQHHEGE